MDKKEDLPYLPLYIGDWMKAPEIRAMPRAYRANCIDLYCFMWESPERPYLIDKAGKPYNKQELCSMLAYEEGSNTFEVFYQYILNKKIFSFRESDKAMYSRFLLKIIELSKKRAAAGSKGGRASKLKAGAQASLEDEINSSSSLNDQEEKQEEGTGKVEPGKVARGTFTPLFEKFWTRQANKVGKGAAFRKWEIATRDTPGETLIAAWERQLPYYRKRLVDRDQDFPHPETWISQMRWLDDPEDLLKKHKRDITPAEMNLAQKRVNNFIVFAKGNPEKPPPITDKFLLKTIERFGGLMAMLDKNSDWWHQNQDDFSQTYLKLFKKGEL